MDTPAVVDVYGGIEFGINVKAWTALTDAQRTIVETVSEAENSPTIGELPEDIWDMLRRASRRELIELAETSKFHTKLADVYYAYAQWCGGYKASHNATFGQKRQPFFS